MEVRLTTGSLVACEDEPFHAGAEGELYRTAGGQHVVKLYRQPDPQRRASLEAVIGRYNAVRDDLYWQDYFCWPDGVVERPRLGVRMPQAPAGMRDLNWFLLPKARACLQPSELGTWSGHRAETGGDR